MGTMRRYLVGFLLSALWLLATEGGNGWGWAQEFSADQLTIRGTFKQEDSIYFRPDRWRVEAKGGPFPEIIIVRLDKKAVWKLLPQERRYIEMPLRPEDLPVPERIPGEIERKVVGQEQIEGYLCDKLLIRYTYGGAEGEASEMYLWVSPELKAPLRTEAPDLDWKTELRNIRVGPQRDDLFEVPPGYDRFEPPAGPMSTFVR